MKVIHQSFKVAYKYPVFFTEHVFQKDNSVLLDIIGEEGATGPKKSFIVIDQGVYDKHPYLIEQIQCYFESHPNIFHLAGKPFLVPGGEDAKNDPKHLKDLLAKINEQGLCRHSYIIGIGGGAVLDLVGYAAATAHRGIRHIRIPTTVLAQNDSGIGVKNSVNAFGKKNFLGTFSPPVAVINDYTFLYTLNDRDWRSGIAEAIKVALIKDELFFKWIQSNASKLDKRDMKVIQELIYRCAQLHLEHIASGDPFEMGSSRPLDFGHWASHKLEQLSEYSLKHGEAVAIGIGLDSIYSYLSGLLSKTQMEKIIFLIKKLKFKLYTPELSENYDDNINNIIAGLEEFREHLGGELTIMLLEKIGRGKEVNHMNPERIKESIRLLKNYHTESASVDSLK